MTEQTFKSKEQEVLENLVKAEDLNRKYGHISCFDVPKAYDQMEEHNDSAYKAASLISAESMVKTHSVTTEGVLNIFREIAKDIQIEHEMNADDVMVGIERGFITLESMDHDEFIEQYVVNNEQNELFDSLYYYVDIDTRVSFLKDNFLVDLDIYYTTFLDYLVLFQVDEEVYHQYISEKWEASKGA